MTRLSKLRTLARLGSINIARVAIYRLGLRSGLHPVQRLCARVAQAPFFRAAQAPAGRPSPNWAWTTATCHFGWYHQPLPDTPPDWFANPFSDQPQPDATRDWWRIPDFGHGDIKGVWELSRFDWAVAWGTQAAQGDAQALDLLNRWVADWAAHNPPYKGPNWKCGQEASIRVMHLCVVAWLLGQDDQPEQGLVDLLACHLQRIAPTVSYAIGQANNHGTSEAAALFIGGSFLIGHHQQATNWANNGRRLLEERAQKLIESDGSFSQYSVTYHRVMLDTYAMAEAWRYHRGLPEFSFRLRERLSVATEWLWGMTNAETGDAPNIGANDGSRLLQLTGSDYRDFRPSVQLAAALFRNADAYGSGPWNNPLSWLGVAKGKPSTAPSSQSLDQGGYHVLRNASTMAVMRYPRFRFRPGQADALHLDLWHAGRNLLRDAGTYSYNASSAEWFGGTSSHNTVEFDGRDQMPRLSRFLFGDWLSAQDVETVHDTLDGLAAGAGYSDRQGARHYRRVILGDRQMTVTDRIGGRFDSACLRWRLEPGEYTLEPSGVSSDGLSLHITAEGQASRLQLTCAPESRYYQHKDEVPVLEVALDKPTTITTTVDF